MDQIRITGGKPIIGTIEISGAKNAALPLMAASLLTDEPLTLANIPHLMDITTMSNLLVHLGQHITMDASSPNYKGHSGRVLQLRKDKSRVSTNNAPYEIVRKMRASFLVLGPLLARYGKARVSLPGGCAIGTRPIDFHLEGFRQMGAEISLKEGYVEAKAPKGLKGAEIRLPRPSVGATENILMAATLASGTTIIENAAREPEVTDLTNCLKKMGADIEGIDTKRLIVKGVSELKEASYSVLPDRIAASTYAIAAAITGGDIVLCDANPGIMGIVVDVLKECGVQIDEEESGLRVRRKGIIHPIEITTAPYPGFPTDMQAQIMALLCFADGQSRITETIFENRFMHVPELVRMGADIEVSGNIAQIKGVKKLKAAPVMATDLRASVSLVLAALAAEGTTTINRVYHLDRGYERLEEKLSMCGAEVKRVRGE